MNSTHHTQRPAAVAGLFYPGDAVELRATLARLLGNAAPASVRPPRALIVPHAGYVYSGAVAAAPRCPITRGRETTSDTLISPSSPARLVRFLRQPGSRQFRPFTCAARSPTF